MSMRSIKINVNGKPYTVEVGDLTASPVTVTVNGQPYFVDIEGAASAQAAPVQAPAVKVAAVQAAPAAAPVRQAAPAGVTGEIRAPMPGTIITIEVKAGDQVKRGDPLCFLEAMKMKNAIRSPQDGVVLSVDVSCGAKVGFGDLLVRLG
jgi:glutaconyl-CoA/methylmalonyl-CoA decarboxylase subunit gamma